MDWLRRALAPWVDRLQSVRAVAGADRWGYRGKVCLSAVWNAADGWNFGLWRRDELIPIPDCPVHTGLVRTMVRWLREALPPGATFPLAFTFNPGRRRP